MKKLLAALAALLLAPTAHADVLVDNVNGYTLNAQGRLIRFSALLVGDDGKIQQLYSRGDKKAERTRYRFDGKGRTLIPGLIDAHGHVLDLGIRAMTLDLSQARSLADAQARIAAYAAANPTPRWIIGGGWNSELWGLGRYPTAADIDALAPGRPIWLKSVDGQAGWANKVAMKEAGIDAASLAPAGGRIERAGKLPTGIFVGAATQLVERAIPRLLPRVRDRALVKAQEILLSSGLTSVADMGTSTEDWMAMRRLGDNGRLNIRILSYAAGIAPLLEIAGPAPTPWLYDDRLRMRGVLLSIDGGLGTRGAWLKQDYRDSPANRGLPLVNDTELKNLMSRAAMDDFQVAVEAVGDAAITRLLDAIEELADTYKGDRRWRVEHAQIVDPADLPRFAIHGTIASMQPVQQISEWKMAEARIGLDRLGAAYAWRSMIANKVPLAFGSDFPAYAPNPFHGIAAALTRSDGQGQPPGGWMAEQRLSLLQAFEGFTRGAAYASLAEDRIGTLERGRMADFIFVDRDIFADATPDQIRDTKVLETWVAGVRVWPN